MVKEDYIPGTSYKILQSDEYFKFGIDSILLSSFAKMKPGRVLADLGTGVGILALRCHYLYQPSQVYAYEIQEGLARLAAESVKANGLQEDIQVFHQDIRRLEGLKKLDYIITNPPYYERGRSLSKANEAKDIAFHEGYMNLDDIFGLARSSLVDKGRLFMVNRAHRLADVIEKARLYKMEPARLRLVYPYQDQPAKLFLADFIKGGGKNLRVESPLIIYDKDGTYTEEIGDLYYGQG